MRRFALLLAALGVSAGLSGCVGPDGPKAEALLQQAQEAQANVSSERFVMRLDVEAAGRQVSIAMQGGAYLKGPRRGDFVLTVDGSGIPGLENTTTTVVRHGATAEVRANGRTEEIPVPTAESRFGSPVGMLDLARYVTSVSVDSSQYEGRPADRIVGKLDTQALLANAGVASSLLGSSGVHFGDIRAVLFVPRDSHRVEVMFADLDVKA